MVSPSVMRSVVCGLVLVLAGSASAEGVRVPRSIGFAKSASVRQAVKDECELQTRIPAAIADAAPGARLVDGRGDLRMEISEAHGPGGGVFSGPKWVEVTGRFRRGGKSYSFRAKRFSAMDPFGGTCRILQKCGTAVARDIAAWLESPTSNAELGDAQ